MMNDQMIAKELFRVASLIQAKAKLPRSKRDWQLYDEEPSSDKAARELTSGLKKAEKYIIGKLKKSGIERDDLFMDVGDAGEILYEGFKKYVDPLLDKHRDAGASDSEPRYVAANYLSNVIKDFYDITWYLPLTDYV